MLNSRMRTILRELMTAHTPITSTYLANLNQVTTRTIREDIKSLDLLLADNGAQIESIMGKGYKLTILDNQGFRKYLQSNFSEDMTDGDFVPESPEERIFYTIKRLLLCETYVKLDDLADEMFISKSTIQNDLKHVKQILGNFDIKLISRPNYGVKVVGSELKLRFCMAEYIFDRNDRSRNHMIEGNLQLLPKKNLEIIHDIILKQIKANHITLSDIAINNLFIHISIAYKRIKNGNHVTLIKAEVQEIMEQVEYRVAQKMVREVEDAFGVIFPQSEVAYIAIHLLGTKMLTQTSTGDKLVEHVMDEDILNLVMAALDKIESKLNLELKGDQELVMGLCLHLKPAINRYKYGMNIRNPMLTDIKKNYPLAFEAGVIAGLTIEGKTGKEINENEVGYIALHIGAAIERKKMESGPKQCLIVCASGLGTARLIYYKLKNHFGKSLDVIGTTEFYNLSQHHLHNIDFIVSSIPISEELPVPIIEVNAIVGDNDLAKIEQFIVNKKRDIHSFFKKDLMYLGEDFSSMDEVLEFLHLQLLSKGLVEAPFLDAIYEREKVAPTSFGNLVAIPHPITPESNHTFLAVCTLKKPIIWNNKSVQLVCLLSVKKNSQEDLQSMYDVLGKIIDNGSVVHQLIKAKTFDEFMDVLVGSAI
ncbi:PRD domain-containing protein [Virgibacillus dakarensis]|uniref:BglG family transcription antiterminator n=1 Tax=Virgibacillus dakarensis TaxID=1917889 RepID=UPI000B437585|nr:BglG family transcription antiterminator [Virgibacillus dakarensis]MBT2217660.1 BglG family transcription antiterminator [Virgibacillus dakarensis]MTW86705.1 PRD domain-containing protein [Virgibacillus dakarensis]